MKIRSSNAGYNQKFSQPSFKQITPKHMYINSFGYDHNRRWTNNAIKIINKAKDKVSNNTGFSNLMEYISDNYSDFLDEASEFGQIRTQKWSTFMKGKYKKYKDRMLKLTQSSEILNYENPDEKNSNYQIKRYTSKIKSKNTNEIINLNEILHIIKGHDVYKTGDVILMSPDPEAIPKTFEEATVIYNNILNNKGMLSDDNIKMITSDIAKLHWLISQVRPYSRGTAGIADIFAKSLFEAKGIQVSPYKKDVNPNLEAFITTIEAYQKEYENFFSEALHPISENVQKPKTLLVSLKEFFKITQ